MCGRGALALAFVWTVPIGVVACGAADRDASGVVVRDSAGVTIVDNAEPAWGEGDAWRLAAEPALDLGGPGAPPPEQFQSVSDAVRLADGRIVVADAGSGEIRVFDAEGAFVRAFGGEGGGPGEFRRLRSIRVGGDTLVAYDSSQRRLTWFDLEGRRLRTVALDLPAAGPSRSMYELPWLDDGTLLLIGGAERSVPMGTLERPPVAILVYAATESRPDTLAVVPGPELGSWAVDGRSLIGAPPPIARKPVVAARGRRIYVGTQATREIVAYDGTDAIDRRIRWRGGPLDVAEEDRERFVSRYLERSTQRESSRRTVAPLLEAAPLPDRRPAYGELRVDAAGHLWVADYSFPIPGLAPTRWSVFDRDGRLLGAVEVPDRFDVRRIGADYVLGVGLDEYDVEHVRLYPLRKPEG